MGISLPVLDLAWTTQYFTPAIISDIANNLGADYVRTQWVPQFWLNEGKSWQKEDAALGPACKAGMKIGIIMPGPNEVPPGWTYQDQANAIHSFFERYTDPYAYVPGFFCNFVYAEIGSEENLPKYDVSPSEYASYYAAVVPTIYYFQRDPQYIVTAGPSGVHYSTSQQLSGIQWTRTVAPLLSSLPGWEITSFGIDPYGTAPSDMQSDMQAMATAASCASCNTVSLSRGGIAVTDIGMNDTANEGGTGGCVNHDLRATIENLSQAPVQFMSIYEYKAQPDSDATNLALVTAEGNHTCLYSDAKTGFAFAHANESLSLEMAANAHKIHNSR